MRMACRVALFLLLPILVAGLSGCPGRNSVVGEWELSRWDGPCVGDPEAVLTATFNDDGDGTLNTTPLLWIQDGRRVLFNVESIGGLFVAFDGTVEGSDRMSGIVTNTQDCWEAVRVPDAP